MNSKNYLISIILILITINNSVAQQFLDKTLMYDGETRMYKIYIPASYDGNTPFPLMFSFHGGSGDIASQVAIADMRPIADTANFILVYPQALPDPNDGGSTNWLHKEPTDVDDVFFVEAMIDTIALDYGIDVNRVYACGYSLGGELTYELACRLNNKIAAIGAVARTMGTAAFNNCSPTHPTGILTILGTDDSVSPYEGLTWAGIQYYLSADEMHDYWANHNNASTQPTITQLPNTNTSDGSTVELHSWGEGDECTAVEHLKIIGGGHDWPGSFGNMDIDASLEIWNYVSKYNLSGLIDCNATSTHENISERNKTTIYPNPVTNILIINRSITENQVYQIFSSTGKVVHSGTIDSNQETINLSALPPSIYFLKIENKLMKFIKTK